MRHTRHILSYSGGKDSTAMYLLALELAERHGFDFTPVFADTGNEHEATLDYVRDLPRRTGGPEIRWVKADFAEDFERKRRFIAAKWPGDLVKDVPGRWEVRPEFILQDGDGETEVAECVPDEVPAEPADPYRPMLSTFYQWVPARRGLSPEEAAIRVERALAALHPTGNPFLDLCMLKGRFPSTKARFCSEELKHHPVFYQVQEPLLEAGHRVLSWQGVRAEESASRAKLRRFEHVGGGLWNWRPIFRWTAETVFAMHRRHDVPPNPLYTLGMGRVGCMPCIHARKDEIWEIARRFPEHIDRIEAWETAVGMCAKREGIGSFFAADKTANHDKTKPIPGIRDVVAWASTGRGGRQFDLLKNADDIPRCSSIYGLCE